MHRKFLVFFLYTLAFFLLVIFLYIAGTMVSLISYFWTFHIFFLLVCIILFVSVIFGGLGKSAPASLRRWGGNGPLGWRATLPPWFPSPLSCSSLSVDDDNFVGNRSKTSKKTKQQICIDHSKRQTSASFLKRKPNLKSECRLQLFHWRITQRLTIPCANIVEMPLDSPTPCPTRDS